MAEMADQALFTILLWGGGVGRAVVRLLEHNNGGQSTALLVIFEEVKLLFIELFVSSYVNMSEYVVPNIFALSALSVHANEVLGTCPKSDTSCFLKY